MIDFLPYQVWFVRTEGVYDEAEAWATGPHSYLHVVIGNASRLQIPEYADAWLKMIQMLLDGYEEEFADQQV